MDESKDYYAILGVHEKAEDLVIKVAYRALAQKYHPDTYVGPKHVAHQKMVLVNEAHSILSDSVKRKEYDLLRGSGTHDASSYYDESDFSDEKNDPLHGLWETAIKYHEGLDAIDKKLSKISLKLSYTFRAYILESRKFSSASEIADLFSRTYMQSYFGENKEILDFAYYLIDTGNRKAAKELNKVICVFGDKVDADFVVNKIVSEFNISYQTRKEKVIKKQNKVNDDFVFSQVVRNLCRCGKTILNKKCPICGMKRID